MKKPGLAAASAGVYPAALIVASREVFSPPPRTFGTSGVEQSLWQFVYQGCTS